MFGTKEKKAEMTVTYWAELAAKLDALELERKNRIISLKELKTATEGDLGILMNDLSLGNDSDQSPQIVRERIKGIEAEIIAEESALRDLTRRSVEAHRTHFRLLIEGLTNSIAGELTSLRQYTNDSLIPRLGELSKLTSARNTAIQMHNKWSAQARVAPDTQISLPPITVGGTPGKQVDDVLAPSLDGWLLEVSRFVSRVRDVPSS